jgi:hypothetical protein
MQSAKANVREYTQGSADCLSAAIGTLPVGMMVGQIEIQVSSHIKATLFLYLRLAGLVVAVYLAGHPLAVSKFVGYGAANHLVCGHCHAHAVIRSALCGGECAQRIALTKMMHC